MAVRVRWLDFKAVTRNLYGAKAAAAVDDRGRVLLVVSETISRQCKLASILWGVFQALRLRTVFYLHRPDQGPSQQSPMWIRSISTSSTTIMIRKIRF